MQLLISAVLIALVAAFMVWHYRRDHWTLQQAQLELGLEQVGPRTYAGERRGHAVHVRLRHGHQKEGRPPAVQISYQVEVPRLPSGLFLHPEDFGHSVMTMLGRQDIETGHTMFDDAFVIRGDDADAIERMLAEPTIRRQIMDTYRRFLSLEIRDGTLRAERRGGADVDDLDALIDLAEALASSEPPAPAVAGVDPSLYRER